MHVFLTIDVECYSGDYEAEVWASGLGINYLLETLHASGLKATFFVEALGARRWGQDATTRICRAIQTGGHDIQLHLHPVIALAWGVEDRHDRLAAFDLATQKALIAEGKALLEQCSGQPVNAFRAGDLAANRDTLKAMAVKGVFLGSNRDMDLQGSIASAVNDCFPVSNDLSEAESVTDLPVSCFESPLPLLDGRYRHLQTTAVAFSELRFVLHRMAHQGYRTATILTHPGEFFVRSKTRFLPNRKNRRRWERLLAMLGRSGWPVGVVRDIGSLDAGARAAVPIVRGNLVWALQRVIEQGWWRIRQRRISSM